MNILVIGGTQFLGRYIVTSAISSGHSVTLFNRQESNPTLFPNIEIINGDRGTSDIYKLKDKKWDVVIDTCGYWPIDLKNISSVLRDNIGLYVFISTCSVYDLNFEGYADESNKTVLLPPEIDPNKRTLEYYGEKKLLCEQEVINAFGKERSLIIRPGLIVGPYDQTYRFPYWPERFNEGGDILVPGDPKAPIQVVDVRDLAEWTIQLATKQITGVINAVGPSNLTKENFFKICQKVVEQESSLHWIPDKELLKSGVKPWIELPLWLTEEEIGMFKINNLKATSLGLSYREIDKTIINTLKWSTSIADSTFRNNAISRQKEQKLIKQN